MENDFEINSYKQKKSPRWWIWIFVALLCALLLSNLAGDTIKNMFYSLVAGITPIIVAFVLSFILLHPIKWIENGLLKNAFVGNPKGKVYKRAISLGICYTVIIGVVIILLIITIPYLINAITELTTTQTGTQIAENLKTQITRLIVNITGLAEADVINYIGDFFANVGTWLTDWFTSLSAIDLVSEIGSIIFIITMSIVLSFLMLKDKELISNTAKRYNYAYGSKKRADENIRFTRRVRKVLDQWLVCNLIIMAVVFVVAWIGYAIIGIKFAGLLAAILAIFSIVPYIGGFIAMVPVIIVALMYGSTSIMLTSVIYGLAIWIIITSFLPPFVSANRMKTRAVVVMFTLVLCGALLGVWGMLLSGPIAALLGVWLQEKLEIKEGNRERDELLEVVDPNVSIFGTSDLLDTKEDVSNTILDMVESNSLKIPIKKRKQENKDNEKK